jgi:surface antigen
MVCLIRVQSRSGQCRRAFIAMTARAVRLLSVGMLLAGCAADTSSLATNHPSRYEPRPLETARTARQELQSQSKHRQPIASTTQLAGLRPRIIKTSRYQQCVPYARRHSRINIRGNAWTWWRSARGRYQRGYQPAVGSVLALRRKGRSLGHLAVVKRVLSEREIVVDHSNWLNRGQIHKDTRVLDVSRHNDWSAIRLWYIPGKRYGSRVYQPYGFIYPNELQQSTRASAMTHSHGAKVSQTDPG